MQILHETERVAESRRLRQSLHGPSLIRRALMAWSVMVGLMARPHYDSADIKSMSQMGHGKLGRDLWVTARNIIRNAAENLTDACVWFSEYLRWRIQKNADLIFTWCLNIYTVEQRGVSKAAKFNFTFFIFIFYFFFLCPFFVFCL